MNLSDKVLAFAYIGLVKLRFHVRNTTMRTFITAVIPAALR